MKKIFVAAVLSVFFFAQSAFAMTFQQPVEIGQIGISQVGKGGGGFTFNKAFKNDGDYYTARYKDNTASYGKGVAQFGEDVSAVYVHYDAYKKNKELVRVGSRDVKNTVSVSVFNTWIYKIATDEDIVLYAFHMYYGPDSDWTIVGKRKDGTFVKYFDTVDITKKYFAPNRYGAQPASYGIPVTKRNTLIFKYRTTGARKDVGEFRFKWNEAAQWFGVEQVVY